MIKLYILFYQYDLFILRHFIKNTFQYFYFVTTFFHFTESDGPYVHTLELNSNIYKYKTFRKEF